MNIKLMWARFSIWRRSRSKNYSPWEDHSDEWDEMLTYTRSHRRKPIR